MADGWELKRKKINMGPQIHSTEILGYCVEVPMGEVITQHVYSNKTIWTQQMSVIGAWPNLLPLNTFWIPAVCLRSFIFSLYLTPFLFPLCFLSFYLQYKKYCLSYEILGWLNGLNLNSIDEMRAGNLFAIHVDIPKYLFYFTLCLR